MVHSAITRWVSCVSTLMLLALWLGVAPVIASSSDELYAEEGIALAGYDPVAYFTMEEALEGSDQYTAEWGGAVWHFVNQDHAALFAADPEKYTPKYGGFCAFGVSKGYEMKPDVTAWEIHDGQLYLYFSSDVSDVWAQDRETNQSDADAQWDRIQAE